MQTNQTAKHTPGPWHMDERGDIVSEFGLIARLYGWAKPDDETLPNARLIAQAPALLEALRMMLDAFNVKEIDPLVAFATIEKARSAIARAEGR